MAGFTCPQCGKRMILNLKTSRVVCPGCGHVREDEISKMDASVQKAKATDYSLAYIGKISFRAAAIYEAAHTSRLRGDTALAVRGFLDTLAIAPDFLDPHLWLAKLADTPKMAHNHLDSILAQDPTHGEALRQKMLLTGKLTAEQVAQSYKEDAPKIEIAEGPVATNSQGQRCPNCGGNLQLNSHLGRLACVACDYTVAWQHEADSASTADGGLLATALLERRAKPTRWQVGQRLVACQQCGAEHTLPAGKLSARCRFCGSANVILGDSLGSFEQPNLILPFALDHNEAEKQIGRALNQAGQKLANLLNNNRMTNLITEGVYVPFWAFDVMVEVQETHTYYSLNQPVRDTNLSIDTANNVLIPAVKSPAPNLLARLAPYNLDTAIVYDPQWLAAYPAQLYSTEIDQASLSARSEVSEVMRRKHNRQTEQKNSDERGNSRPERWETRTRIQNMLFQLVLLPVWIAEITEVDGDKRLALINGQDGRVVFGETRR
jgi:uncharacterized Zn finger protein (UPF0148 family)